MKTISNIKTALILAVFIFAFISIELILRIGFGFCDAVLIREDSDYEYIAISNQNRVRFGNRVQYNDQSMRSLAVDSNAIVILGFGDSVINGGSLTNQSSLATSIISEKLTDNFGQNVQFLNISAGSWGPDNCFNFLEKHGSYNARHILLIVSSHDAYDNITHEKIVGVSKGFPNQQYSLAILEMFDRYFLPYFNKDNDNLKLGINKRKKDSVFNTGFADFYKYSIYNNIPLTIYLHAEMSEIQANTYNSQGKEIIEYAKINDIPIILDLNHGLAESDFRDRIHLNDKGQSKMANIILENIEKYKNQYFLLYN